MSENTRKGLGLLAAAGALWLVSNAADNQAMRLVWVAALMLGIGGLLLTAFGLIRD